MDFTALVRSQRELALGGPVSSAKDRIASLKALLDATEVHEKNLLDALHADLGKAPVESFMSEIQMVRGECRHAIQHLTSWMKPTRKKTPFVAWPGRSEVRREPCGSVLIIGPWNYPVHLTLTPAAGALAAGCSTVIKPSERAPHVAEAIASMIGSTFPSSRMAVVTGKGDTSAALLRESFDHVFFTGSRSTGIKVMEAAAKHPVPVTLELGGKCPVIFFGGKGRHRDKLIAHMDTAARRIAWGKYLNAGQTCVAPDHILVERELLDPLVSSLEKAFRSFGLRDYARLVDREHFERVRAFLGQGNIAYGGKTDDAELRIDPTLLVDIPPSAPLMEEEIFGPILPLIPCDSLEEAIVSVNSRPDPLAIYPFTHDPDVLSRITVTTRSGAICSNDVIVQVAGVDLPFGGTGASGMGRYRGRASFDIFTRERVIVRRSLWPDLPFRYPPVALSLERLKRLPRFMTGG